MIADARPSGGGIMTAATLSSAPPRPVKAPLTRLLRSELRWVFRRPRTLVALGLLTLVPIVIGIAIRLASPGFGDDGGGPGGGGGGLFAQVAGNGLVLPVAALAVSLALLLPLVGAMSAADALAGESANGTLRGLLLAPIGRVRLLGVKAFGVASVVLAGVFTISVAGVITGLVLVGSNGLLTLSGTTLPLGVALGRVALAALWVVVQVWAVAAIALAVSACTEHPLVVMASTLAGAIVFGVLSSISSLTWLRPYLLTDSWGAVADVLRDPLPTDGLLAGLFKALCYLAIGMSLALVRVLTKDG